MPSKNLKKAVPPVSEWSVKRHGIQLFIDAPIRSFKAGVSLDVEDDERGGFVGLGIFDHHSRSAYYWSRFELAKQLTIPPFCAHNGRSDLEKLKAWGFAVDETYLIHDTQLYAHIIDSSRKMYGLKPLVKAEFNEEYPSYEDLTGKKTGKNHITLDKLPVELVAEYNACDTWYTWKLYDRQSKTLY